MPPRKGKNLSYSKDKPFKDAKKFIIICEGERESDYFNFFNGKSKRLIIETLDPTQEYAGKSAPNHLYERANQYVETYGWDEDYQDSLYFVLDVDKWERNSIDELRKLTNTKTNWDICISNPCFEVWLYYHIKSDQIKLNNSNDLKQLLDKAIKGGYQLDKFVKKIESAILNSSKLDLTPKSTYPDVGTTKVYKLGKEVVASLGYENGAIKIK